LLPAIVYSLSIFLFNSAAYKSHSDPDKDSLNLANDFDDDDEKLIKCVTFSFGPLKIKVENSPSISSGILILE
jgi:hypothetical protein